MGKRKADRPLSRPKKRRFSSNQFVEPSQEITDHDEVFESIEIPTDRSYMKIRGLSFTESLGEDASTESDEETSDACPDDSSSLTGNRIFNVSMLQELISSAAVCNSCKEGHLVMEEVKRHGLAPELQLSCTICDFSTSRVLAQQSSIAKTKWNHINRQAALAMRMIGRGYNALCMLCMVLDIPKPMSKPVYDSHRAQVHKAAVEIGSQSMKTAAAAVIEYRSAEAAPSDIAVTCDGTWMRRGHSSLYGVQTVLSWQTGQVLDVEALSKHCAACASWRARKESGSVSPEEFATWKASHGDACGVNTTVSAPAMESTAAVTLWSRSEEKNSLRYVRYIGDGDSKVYNNVANVKLYGEKAVVKEECVGHIQKRLGKSLRDLKQKLGGEKLSDGKSIGGKGRPTDKMIGSLQNYYGKAIRSNAGSTAEIARAIWASICHQISTDETPRHEFCPEDSESWCKFQKAKATGKNLQHKPALPRAVFEKVKPIYLRLSDKPLLEKCLRGATQMPMSPSMARFGISAPRTCSVAQSQSRQLSTLHWLLSTMVHWSLRRLWLQWGVLLACTWRMG